MDLKVQLVLQVVEVQQELRVHKELKGQQDQQVLKVIPGQQVLMVHKEHKVLKEDKEPKVM